MIDINMNCPDCGGNEFKNAYLRTNSTRVPVTSKNLNKKGVFKGTVTYKYIGEFQYKICINCGEIISTKLIPPMEKV